MHMALPSCGNLQNKAFNASQRAGPFQGGWYQSSRRNSKGVPRPRRGRECQASLLGVSDPPSLTLWDAGREGKEANRPLTSVGWSQREGWGLLLSHTKETSRIRLQDRSMGGAARGPLGAEEDTCPACSRGTLHAPTLHAQCAWLSGLPGWA